MLIKKGMQVRIISGAHKGSEGKVLFASPKKSKGLSSKALTLLKNQPDHLKTIQKVV